MTIRAIAAGLHLTPCKPGVNASISSPGGPRPGCPSERRPRAAQRSARRPHRGGARTALAGSPTCRPPRSAEPLRADLAQLIAPMLMALADRPARLGSLLRWLDRPDDRRKEAAAGGACSRNADPGQPGRCQHLLVLGAGKRAVCATPSARLEMKTVFIVGSST